MSIEILSVEPVVRKRCSQETVAFGALSTGDYFYESLNGLIRRKVCNRVGEVWSLVVHTGVIVPFDAPTTVFPVPGPDSPPPAAREEPVVKAIQELEIGDCFRREYFPDEVLLCSDKGPDGIRVQDWTEEAAPWTWGFANSPIATVQLLRVEARFGPEAP